MLLSIFAIIALLAVLVLTLLLREALAVPVPKRIRMRAIANMRPPTPLAPLFDKADEQLAALGFEAMTWVLVQVEPNTVPSIRLLRLYRSQDRCTVAQVMAPMAVDQPVQCRIHFVSDDRDGRLLFTVPKMPETLPVDPDLAQTQMGHYADLAEQWQAHRSLLTGHSSTPLPWLDSDQVLRRLNAYEHGTQLRAIHLGAVDCHGDGSLRLSPRRALRALGQWLRHSGTPPVVGESTTDRQLALVWQNWKRLRRHTPTNRVQLGLFTASAVAFAVAFAWWIDLRFAVLLLAVIALHEGGHWWAMRRLGYHNVQVLMLPMMGGVTIGHEQQPRARDRAWVSLMGPLPGIALGLALFAAGIDASDGWLYLLALLLLLVNLFNLLPVLPLDGGHLLHALLPERAVAVRMAFDALAVLALVALAWWLDVWWLALLALVPANGLRHGGRDRRWLSALRQVREQMPADDELTEAAQASTVLRRQPDAPPLLPNRIVALDNVLTQARLQPMARSSATVLTAIWIACFAITLALPQVRAVAGIAIDAFAPLAAIEREFRVLRDEAQALNDDELVERVIAVLREAGAQVRRTDAGVELDAAQQRIGIELHPVYRALHGYRFRQPGDAPVDLAPPDRLDWLRNRPDCLRLLDRQASWPGFADDEPVQFSVYDLDAIDTHTQEQSIRRSTLLGWLVISPCNEATGLLHLVEAEHPDWPLWQLQLQQPVAVRHARLRDPLESIHVNARFQQVLRERYAD